MNTNNEACEMLGYRLSEGAFIEASDGLLTDSYKEILDMAQMCLSEAQFKIFRKKVLDLFEGKGLKRQIRELVGD